MNTKIASSIFLLLTLLSGSVFGVDEFYKDRARGWFWREEPPETPKPKKKLPPPVDRQAAPVEPPLFSVEWFRKNLDAIRNRAIDNPTPENVEALLSAERVMRDKATKYAMVTQQVLRDSPWLDENVRRPTSLQGENLVETMASDSIDRNAPLLASQTAIWFFYRSDCPYCKEQIAALAYLAERYGFRVLPISLDGAPLPGSPFPRWEVDTGQAANLKVTVTPTLYLVRPPNSYAALAYGLTPAQEIVTRAIDIAAKEGWLEPGARDELFHAKDPGIKAQTFNTPSLQRINKDSNPAEINRVVKQYLKGQ